MAHEQRVRAGMLEAGGAQRVDARSLVLPDVTDDGARVVTQRPQAEAYERRSHLRLVGMRHQPQLVRLGTAPVAQSQPTAEPDATVEDVCLAGWLEHRQIPGTPAARPRVDEL